MTQQTIKQFKHLITEFDDLPPIPRPEPTIFEISGYPHYEDVISNILRFFFDGSQNHSLSPLFIRALLRAAGKNVDEFDETDFETIRVEREYPTATGNRIDLFIETDSLSITIENKIYASLYNDLTDYRKFIVDSTNKRDSIFIVLSLYKLDHSEKLTSSKFIPITYESFFNELENQLGKELTELQSHHLLYITDLIKSLRNMSKSTQLSPKFIEFLTNNKSKIEDLYQRTFRDFKNELSEKANVVFDLVEDNQDYERKDLRKTNTLEYVSLYQKTIQSEGDTFTLQIKLRLQPKGYAIELWTPDDINHKPFTQFISKKLDNFSELEPHPEAVLNSRIYDSFDYSEKPSRVSDVLNELTHML